MSPSPDAHMSESAIKRDRTGGADGDAVGGAPAGGGAAGPSVESELEGDEGDCMTDRPMEDHSGLMSTEAFKMLMREQAEAEHGYARPRTGTIRRARTERLHARALLVGQKLSACISACMLAGHSAAAAGCLWRLLGV